MLFTLDPQADAGYARANMSCIFQYPAMRRVTDGRASYKEHYADALKEFDPHLPAVDLSGENGTVFEREEHSFRS